MGCTGSTGREVASATDPQRSAGEQDLRTPHLKQKIILSSPITCIDISEDLSMLALGTEDGVLHVFSTMSVPVEDLAHLKGHTEGITCCHLYGRSVFSASEDCSIIKWSLLTMRAIYAFRGHHSKVNSILCVGGFLFSSSYDRTAMAWRISPADAESHDETGTGEVSSEKIDPRTEYFDRDRDPLHVCTFRGHEKGVYPLAFIPADDNHDCERELGEMDLLVTGSADCTARIWSAATADCRHILTGHTLPIHAIAVNNNDKTIFTAGADGLIMSFCSITGDRLRSMIGHEAAILRFDTHKNMLYSASADKTVRAWVMEFGEDTRVFRGSRAPVTCVQYFDGFVISGSEDGSCRVFDSKSGTLLRCFRGHTSPVIDLRCVPRKVITAHQDGVMSVWDSDGLCEETVFRDFDRHSCSSDSQSDSSDVVEAVRILEKHLRQR